MTPDQIRRIVWTLEWQCYGKDRGDAEYWIGKWPELVARGIEINHPNYAEHRVMGMGAGGSDIPTYGPYSPMQSPLYGPVPPYPGGEPQPVPDPPPVSDLDLGILGELVARLDKIEAAIVSVASAQSTINASQEVIKGQLARGFSNKYLGAIIPR